MAWLPATAELVVFMRCTVDLLSTVHIIVKMTRHGRHHYHHSIVIGRRNQDCHLLLTHLYSDVIVKKCGSNVSKVKMFNMWHGRSYY